MGIFNRVGKALIAHQTSHTLTGMFSRRSLLAAPLAGALKAKARLLIDTHLEVWTDDPRFPFAHPERPDLKRVAVQGPIENQVEQMKEFGLKFCKMGESRLAT